MGGIALIIIFTLLIIIGFVMVVFGLFWRIVEIILDLFKTVFYIIFKVYDRKKVDSKLGSANWTEEELKMISQAQYSKRPQYKEKARKEVYDGILLFSARMQAKYPKADKELFNKIESEFLQATELSVFKEYEEMVKNSHEKNSGKLIDTIKYFTLNELIDVTPVETVADYPIIVDLYDMDNYYVLKVFNATTDETSLYQSQNYTLVRNYLNNVKDSYVNNNNENAKIKSISLDDVL